MRKVELSDIRWAGYKGYSGPAYWGKPGLVAKQGAIKDEKDRIMAVLAATEGGGFNLVNMYDRCVLTVGLIQWCENPYLFVSKMLSYVHKRFDINHHFEMACNGVYFDGKRWQTPDGEASTSKAIKSLFLGGSDGISWTEGQKKIARVWARDFANLFLIPEAIEAQAEFTRKRLMQWFLLDSGKKAFARSQGHKNGEAFRAVFISWAANNPKLAEKALNELNSKEIEFSEKWLREYCKKVVGIGFDIYPDRLKKITPVVKKIYGLHLGKIKQDTEFSSEKIQELLVGLGYDIGPSGVDGIIGKLTKKAIGEFQKNHNLPETKEPDKDTVDYLVEFSEINAMCFDDSGVRDGVS